MTIPPIMCRRTRIPVSNAVTAMEVWLLACMLLVFLSLVQYAVILRHMVMYRRKKENPKSAPTSDHMTMGLFPEVADIKNGEVVVSTHFHCDDC